MDSNSEEKNPSSVRALHHHHHHDGHRHHLHGHNHHHHHHHHLFYIASHCPLHQSILQPNNHSPSCSFSTSYPSHQNPEPVSSIPPEPYLSFQYTQHNQTFDDAPMIETEIEKLEVEKEEEEEEPIFVLTDEWREFFAKSEAKRRRAKKQARRGRNRR